MNETDVPLVVLISGRGSNLQAIIDAIARGDLPGRIAAVISNRPDAPGLERAAAAGIATEVIDHTHYTDRQVFDHELRQRIAIYRPKWIVLAGWMRLLGGAFNDDFEQGRVLNIHPSLLPELRGLNTHRRALDAGLQRHGASAHFVTRGLDSGPVILQAAVPVLPDDDPETLAARVLEKEHVIYPLALRWLCEGRVTMIDNRVLLEGRPLSSPLMLDSLPSATTRPMAQ